MEGLTDSERRRLPGLDSVGRHEADDDDDDGDGGDEVVQSPHPGEQKVQISNYSLASINWFSDTNIFQFFKHLNRGQSYVTI